MVVAGLVAHPMERAVEVLRFYRQFVETIPDEINTVAGFLTTPDGVKVVVVATCHCGGIEEGEQALRPLREFGPPVLDEIRTQRFSRRSTRTSPGVAAITGSRLLFASCPMTRSRS